MTFEQAMALLRGKGSARLRVTRPGLPGEGVGLRFGEPSIITGSHRHIAYTPTREDMAATDWVTRPLG